MMVQNKLRNTLLFSLLENSRAYSSHDAPSPRQLKKLRKKVFQNDPFPSPKFL
jgi:hypothetical protein